MEMVFLTGSILRLTASEVSKNPVCTPHVMIWWELNWRQQQVIITCAKVKLASPLLFEIPPIKYIHCALVPQIILFEIPPIQYIHCAEIWGISIVQLLPKTPLTSPDFRVMTNIKEKVSCRMTTMLSKMATSNGDDKPVAVVDPKFLKDGSKDDDAVKPIEG